MPKTEQANIRIVDIASMSGVSVATVDRVIHNRGKVSKQNLERIQSVLAEMEYHPNPIARSLASARQYTLYVIIPAFTQGEYWADVNIGIDRAALESSRYNITVKKLFFDQYDRASFDQILTTLRQEHYEGLLIATLFSEKVEPLTHELDLRGLPYVFIDSNIPTCHQLAYYGTSSFDAGVVAARLLLDSMEPDADIVLTNVIHRGGDGSNQWRNRENGFRSYLQSVNYRGQLHYALLRIDDHSYNYRILDALFDTEKRMAGAVTFNSTCYLLAEYLSARQRNNVKLVGYDVIGRNEEMLTRGVVTALIAQRPEAQGYRGVMALSRWLVEGVRPEVVNNMPIDILFKENISYYRNSSF